MSSGEELNPTPVQLFTLSHLFIEDRKKLDSLPRYYTSSHAMQPVTVTTKHLLTIMPGSIIPKTLEIGVWNELNLLVRHRYLKQEIKRQNDEYVTFFSNTNKGTAFVNRYIDKLSRTIKDEKINDQDIDHVDISIGAKEFAKGTLRKVLDKTQDEIASALISGLKIYGPSLIMLFTSNLGT
jgi:hypothetical protein